MDKVLSVKIASLVIAFACGLAGLLIFPLQRRLAEGQLQVVIGYLNAFGSGVMISVSLVHMLAHSQHDLSEYLPGHFPWAMVMAGVGYALVYLCEDVLLDLAVKRFAAEIERSGLAVHTHGAGGNACGHQHEHAHGAKDAPGNSHGHGHSHGHSHSAGESAASDGYLDAFDAGERRPLLAQTEALEYAHDVHTVFMALSLQLVISVHAVFEGLGLGAEKRVSEVVSILLAIVVHKGIESFVVASAYLRSSLDRRLITGLMVLFAAMTPLGIALGIVVSKNPSIKILRGLLVSMAGGTFLYVGTLILKDDNHIGDCVPIAKANSFLRFVLWCLGFASMCLVALWED